MGLETHVTFTVKGENRKSVEDFEKFTNKLRPDFFEDYDYSRTMDVSDNVCNLTFYGEVYHMSVLDWFVDKENTILRFVKSHLDRNYRIYCESDCLEKMDNHKISLISESGNIRLVIDGVEK